MAIKRLIIDVLVPHEPGEVTFAERISELKGTSVTIRVVEVDEKTKTTEMTIEGEDLNYDKIRETIENLGGSVHSVDQVSAGPGKPAAT